MNTKTIIQIAKWRSAIEQQNHAAEQKYRRRSYVLVMRDLQKSGNRSDKKEQIALGMMTGELAI